MIYYEIVWLYHGEEYSLGTYDTKEEALHAFNEGKPRIFKLIHGGKLALDEIVTVDDAAA